MHIGQIVEDLQCVAYTGTNQYGQHTYLMKCIICGREKNMKNYVINRKTGCQHKACGKGLKTLDPIFYSRWQAMRTRTTNSNYWASKHYKEKGINSDEFQYFIDFYDKMYESFLEAAKIYGKENTSLERIDVNKSYSSNNCIWIDKHNQPKNTIRIRPFTAIAPDGAVFKSKNVSEFARQHNLYRTAINDVLWHRSSHHYGWKFYYDDEQQPV